MDPLKFKEEGNEHFKNEDYDEAITCYTKALKFSDRSKNDKDCAIYLKNRSACKLKVEDYEGEIKRLNTISEIHSITFALVSNLDS